jgi:hypothetical protein
MENAEACFAQAASLAARTGREGDVRADALRRLALIRRRAGRRADAVTAWQELIDVAGCPALLRREAREALAIHHEHRSRDLETARTYVLDVLAEDATHRSRAEAEYRLRRIERKMERSTVHRPRPTANGGSTEILENLRLPWTVDRGR